jgi:inosose dehydratase
MIDALHLTKEITMLSNTVIRPMGRRDFLGSVAVLASATGAGLLGTANAARAVESSNWSAPQPDIRFRFSAPAVAWNENIEEAIKVASRLGFPGLEPSRQNVIHYLDKPLVLRKLFDDAGVTMVTCSNAGAPDFSVNFFDPAKSAQTVKDHVAFARDFIRMFGYCDHFKMNMGSRPPGGETGDEHIKVAAAALNEIGRQTQAIGIRLAPHPHVGSLIETEHEVRTLMSLTDPRYVWITADTAHLQLGGMDPYKIITDYYPRVAEIHYKDTAPQYRGATSLVVPKTGPHAGGHGYFRNLGGKDSGGVDFPKIHKFLVDQKYNGWINLDLDATMVEGKDMEETLKININYLVNVLHINPHAL